MLSVKNITKIYGNTVANRNISFSLEKGEVLGVLGENGAGKSTLMRIIYGMERPDQGEVFFNGKPLKLASPKDAIAAGIGMVHQHFMLVNDFTVAENLVLGMPDYTGPVLKRKNIETSVQDYIDKYQFEIDTKAKIKTLPVGVQQRIEILKALFKGAEILILDEPTAVLTPQETKQLAQIIRRLTADGKSVILISHKLDEVMDMCDRCIILRNGVLVDAVEIAKTDKRSLARMMIGNDLVQPVRLPFVAQSRETLLEVDQLTVQTKTKTAVNGVSFALYNGEILGIAGIDGNGQTELVESIAGLRKAASGDVRVKGKSIFNLSADKVRKQGVSHIPEDRHKRGLVLPFSVADNLILDDFFTSKFTTRHVLNRKAIDQNARQAIGDYQIKTDSEHASASSLSGGNQQKIVVAREVSTNPDVLIAMKPTRGLDIGAVDNIHRCLIKERDKGKGILLVSTELDEILTLSDRIAVMHGGKLTGLVWPEEVTPEDIGEMMAGSKTMFTALAPRKGEQA